MKIDRMVIKSLPLFEKMADDELDRLIACASSRLVSQGETIFEQGQPAENFFLLLHGRLKVTQVTPDGQQIIVRVVHPGDLFGFAKALQRNDYPGTAVAAAESLTLSWPTDLWPDFVEHNPRLAVSAMQTIGQRLEEAHTRIREMSTQEVERRVAHCLLRLIRKAGRPTPDGLLVDFPVTRQDIAEMTGTTLHTVSRLMSAWETLGLVKSARRKIIVVDRPALAALAEGDEA